MHMRVRVLSLTHMQTHTHTHTHTHANTHTHTHTHTCTHAHTYLADPAHIPFAHHGLQGTRADAIPINMTVPEPVHGRVISQRGLEEVPGLRGFKAKWGDRTGQKMRSGVEEFRAPFVISYNATFENGSPWSLTTVCVPTRPGWSRLILFQGKDLGVCHGRGTLDEDAAQGLDADAARDERETTEAQGNGPSKGSVSLIGRVFKLLPPFVSHLLANKFLDSDLAFLHYQEQELARRGALRGNEDTLEHYHIPAQPDRATAALRTWIGNFALPPRPLPPAMPNRALLFDRYHQHTSHCRHCRKALEDIGTLRKRLYWTLAALALVAVPLPLVAAVAAVLVLGSLRVLAALEPAFRQGNFEHWKNN
jgi:pheophorbide a oxygenase